MKTDPPVKPPIKPFKPGKSHPWRAHSDPSYPSQNDAIDHAVPHHANPLKRSR